jgi:hypothetical protein
MNIPSQDTRCLGEESDIFPMYVRALLLDEFFCLTICGLLIKTIILDFADRLNLFSEIPSLGKRDPTQPTVLPSLLKDPSKP